MSDGRKSEEIFKLPPFGPLFLFALAGRQKREREIEGRNKREAVTLPFPFVIRSIQLAPVVAVKSWWGQRDGWVGVHQSHFFLWRPDLRLPERKK